MTPVALQVDPSTVLFRGLAVSMGIASGISEGRQVLAPSAHSLLSEL